MLGSRFSAAIVWLEAGWALIANQQHINSLYQDFLCKRKSYELLKIA